VPVYGTGGCRGLDSNANGTFARGVVVC